MNIFSWIFKKDFQIRNILSKSVKKYGWIRDTPDIRDFYFDVPKEISSCLPSKVDLRSTCSYIFDQGNLGSSASNAISSAYMFTQIKQKYNDVIIPSRLFIYYNQRVMEGTVKIDSGSQIRNGIKSVFRKGVCPEEMFPYNISKVFKKPSFKCYWESIKHQIIQYNKVYQTLNDIRGCLASGYPIIFGFSVYESFESKSVEESGIVSFPKKTEKLIGGHVALCVGYNDNIGRFIVQNSWGDKWGMKGYFYIPYEYIVNQNLSADFWMIK